ncbi:MAG: cold-shock protein [Promethearchaeota archaeon]
MVETGTVKWFSPKKGYGFIIRDKKDENDDKPEEIFVHYSSVLMDGFKTLLPGLRVEFEIGEGKKANSVEAKNVKIIPKFGNESKDKE